MLSRRAGLSAIAGLSCNLLPVRHNCLCRLVDRVFILMYICCLKVMREKMNFHPG